MTISSFGAHANVHVGLGSGRYNWRRQRTENHLYGAGYPVLCTVRKTASSLRTTIGHQRFTFYNTWTGCGWVSNKDEKSLFLVAKNSKGFKFNIMANLMMRYITGCLLVANTFGPCLVQAARR